MTMTGSTRPSRSAASRGSWTMVLMMAWCWMSQALAFSSVAPRTNTAPAVPIRPSTSRPTRPSSTSTIIRFASLADDPDLAAIMAVDAEVADGVPPVGALDHAATATTSLMNLALAGALASLIGDMTMHPMDSIKTLQQSDAGYGLSLSQAVASILEESGWRGLYHGFLTYAVSDALGGALKFATFEVSQQALVRGKISPSSSSQYTAAIAACAAIAFVASSTIVVPGELIKQQLQVNYYDSLPAAVSGLFEQGGLLAFYTGYSGVLLRDIPYTMLELGLYDVFKRGMVEHKQQKQLQETIPNDIMTEASAVPSLQAWEEVLAAALTGGITGYVTTPLDTIKTKLMVDHYAGGFMECLTTTIHTHGIGSVFAGGMARVAWLIPFTAIYLPVYDFFKRKLATSPDETDD